MRARSMAGRTLLVLTATSMLVALMLSPAGAADYSGDQVWSGGRTILADETVKGNVTITNGTLTVLGTVEGNILQLGAGSVHVVGLGNSEGLVKGNIEERGDGWVVLFGGTVEGNIDESGRGDDLFGDPNVTGSVIVQSGGVVKGNVVARGDGSNEFGDVRVQTGAIVEGNVEEHGAGSVFVALDGLVKGHVCENDSGTVIVDTGGEVGGSVQC